MTIPCWWPRWLHVLIVRGFIRWARWRGWAIEVRDDQGCCSWAAAMSVRCPKCGNEPVLAVGPIMLRVVMVGPQAGIGEPWGTTFPIAGSSEALCNKTGCGWQGRVSDLLLPGERQAIPPDDTPLVDASKSPWDPEGRLGGP